jgi:hypothetical protein
MCALLPVCLSPSISGLFILRHVRRWCLAVFIQTFLPTGLLIRVVGIPIAMPVSDRIPLPHIPVIAWSVRIGIDSQRIATLSPVSSSSPSLGYDDPPCLATSRPSDCALVLADKMSSNVEGVGLDVRKGSVVAGSVASVVGSSGLAPSLKTITVAVDAILDV